MRKRDIFPLLITAIVVVLLVIGYFTVEGPWRTIDPSAPADQGVTTEGGEEVDETPPSAEGDITDP